MAIQKLADYLKTADFGSAGLPQGDTYIDLLTTEVEEGTYEGRTVYHLKTAEGKEYSVPKTVMSSIKGLAADFAKVRITRQGKEKTDTKYTTVGIK